MLYYFEIQYFEEIHLCEIIAPVILDLPQDNIHDVRLNPFVIDIVNHPFMRAGIERVQNHNEKLVDNILGFNDTISKGERGDGYLFHRKTKSVIINS